MKEFQRIIKTFLIILFGFMVPFLIGVYSGEHNSKIYDEFKVCVAWSASTGECTVKTTRGQLIEDARNSNK